MRKQLVDGWQALLLPAMERAMDELGVGDHTIHIHRLHIRLSGDMNLFEHHDFQERLYREIKAGLEASLQAQTGLGEDLSSTQTRALDAAKPGHHGVPSTIRRTRRLSREQTLFEALLHYLGTGNLIWTMAAPSPDLEGSPAAPQASKVVEILRDTARRERPQLIAFLKRERGALSPDICFRLLQLLPEEDILAILASFGPTASPLTPATGHAHPGQIFDPLEALIKALLYTPSPAPSHSLHTRLQIAASLMKTALESGGALSLDRVKILAAPLLQTMTREERSALLEVLPELTTLIAPTPEPAGQSLPRGEERGFEVQIEASVQRPEEIGLQSSPDESHQPSSDHALAVHNAGLIILHGFIGAFLTRTGVRTPGSKTLEARTLPRALALLHLLATGGGDIHEFELGLCKLLLGIRPDSPCPVGPGLVHEADVAEADALLRSTIAHWQILKKTSVSGLRRAFLERPGWLKEEEDRWRLQVEGAAYDMVLAHLPWGMGIVKLPWMPKPIFTEWKSLG